MDNKKAYLNTIFGIIGTVLIAIGGIYHTMKYRDPFIYGAIFFGYSLTMAYINYLQEKAGVSKKLIWIRSIISIVLILVISIFLFFSI